MAFFETPGRIFFLFKNWNFEATGKFFQFSWIAFFNRYSKLQMWFLFVRKIQNQIIVTIVQSPCNQILKKYLKNLCVKDCIPFSIAIILFIRLGKKRTHSDFISWLHSLCYPLNFGRNAISIALNSNLYNFASMLQCNVFWKLFHIWCLLTDISSFLSQFSSSFKSDC